MDILSDREHRAHHRFADVAGKDPHSPYEYPGWRGYKGLLWAQGSSRAQQAFVPRHPGYS